MHHRLLSAKVGQKYLRHELLIMISALCIGNLPRVWVAAGSASTVLLDLDLLTG